MVAIWVVVLRVTGMGPGQGENVANYERPEPQRIVEDQEHSLYLAYKWERGGEVPSAAVIFYTADTVLRIAEVLTGPWKSEYEAQVAATEVAEKWLWDNSSNNWNPHPKR
jgi:hypothetical protein